MADTSVTIDSIRSNFREGLSVLEYFISSRGDKGSSIQHYAMADPVTPPWAG